MRVIKDKTIVEDSWRRLDAVEPGQALPDGDLILPFRYWVEQRESLPPRNGLLGVCIDGEDETGEVARYLQHFDLIALDFPGFRDGRCYSHARLLRDRYHFAGELRAVGDVLRDQLFYMQRCGINSFQLRADRDMQDALKAFDDFSISYQTAADGAPPVYALRASE